MISPSSWHTMRMMPCIAGWAGPTPTVRFWLPPPVPLPSPSMNSRTVGSAMSDPRADEGLATLDRVVLAQGMPDELLVHEEAPRIRMAGEAHAEHVPHLALEPVRDGPEGHRGGHDGVVLVEADLDAQTVVVADRVEVIHHLEPRP